MTTPDDRPSEIVARLLVTAEEDGVRREFPIGLPTTADQPFVIGRSRGVDLTLHDSYVSQQHVRIVFRDGRHYVSDLDSTHGTSINDTRLESEWALETGDVIGIGRSTCAYASESRAPLEPLAPPPPPPPQKSPSRLAEDEVTADTVLEEPEPSGTEAPGVLGGTSPGTASGLTPDDAEPENGQASAGGSMLGVILAIVTVLLVIGLLVYLAWQIFFVPAEPAAT